MGGPAKRWPGYGWRASWTPLSPLVNALEGVFLATAGRMQEADARLAQPLDIAPEFWMALQVIARMASARGEPAAAVGILEQAAKSSGRRSQVLAMLGPALVAAGNRARAEQLREELAALAGTRYVPCTSRAAISNALGYHGEALDLLECSIEQRDVGMVFLKVDARRNNLRSQPRFAALMGWMRFAGVSPPPGLHGQCRIEPSRRRRSWTGICGATTISVRLLRNGMPVATPKRDARIPRCR